jgi:hypothetical protein
MLTAHVPHLNAAILQTRHDQASITTVRAGCDGHASRLSQGWLQHCLLSQFLRIPNPDATIFGACHGSVSEHTTECRVLGTR